MDGSQKMYVNILIVTLDVKNIIGVIMNPQYGFVIIKCKVTVKLKLKL